MHFLKSSQKYVEWNRFIRAFVRLLFPMRGNISCKCHIITELEPIENTFVSRVWGLVVSVKCLEVLPNRFYCTKCKS